MIALGAFLAGDGIHYASSFASVPRLTFAVPYMARRVGEGRDPLGLRHRLRY
jgi:hypothetical protein